MVAIGNKSHMDGNVSILKSNNSADNVDMLFAELFSLINFNNEEDLNDQENVDILNEINSNQKNSELGNDNKTLDVTKSLVQIFYKELGIIDNKESGKGRENLGKIVENLKNNGEKTLVHKKNNENIINVLGSEKIIKKEKNNPQLSKLQDQINPISLKKGEFDKNNQDKEIIFSIKKVEKNIENHRSINSTNLSKLIQKKDIKEDLFFEKKNESEETKLNKSLNQNNLNTAKRSTKEFSSHLSEKKNAHKKHTKTIDIEKEEESNNLTKNKSVDSRIIPNGNQRVIEVKKESNASFKTFGSKNNDVVENKVSKNFNSNFNNQQILDLMESSWGDKFAKLLKNTINSGLNRVELYLKPKNLGKINLEVAVRNNKTEIQINAETQEAANLLNENISKITELLEEKNNKFSNHFNNQGNNFFNQNNQSKKQNTDNFFGKKKNNVTTKNIKENNHNVDVKA
ncbi:MAG: hypothetical protein CMM95_01745 [Rickettsiales bacterium]|nr:hypothetical protein [Rickettsiales bacterium]